MSSINCPIVSLSNIVEFAHSMTSFFSCNEILREIWSNKNCKISKTIKKNWKNSCVQHFISKIKEQYV
jgi:hypothetical protein